MRPTGFNHTETTKEKMSKQRIKSYKNGTFKGGFKKGHTINNGRNRPDQSKRMGGKNHPKWKGEKKDSNGYVLIYCPKHTKAIDCRVAEHRLVMEKHLGRYLKSSELVHHIDFNRSNNNIENLQLCNKSEHTKIHMLKRWSKFNT